MTTKEKIAWAAAAAIAPIMVIVLTQMGETPEPAVRLDHMNRAQKDSVVAREIRTAAKGAEIVSMRGLNSRVVKLGESKFHAIISVAPMHYLDDADSVYKIIDLTPKDVHELAKDDPLRKFDRYIFGGNYRAGWYKQKPHDYSFYKDDYYVSYTALFDTVDVPIKTEYTTSGVKQTYTFVDSIHVQDLKWLMSSNTVKQRMGDGSIILSDENGTFLFTSLAPTALDASHIPVPVTASISGDTLIYSIEIPEGVKYPVTVDPTTMFTISGAGTGGMRRVAAVAYLTSRNATDYNVGTGVLVGQYVAGSDTGICRVHYYFDTSSLSDAATVTGVKFCLGTNSSDNDDTAFNIRVVQSTSTGTTKASDWYNDFTGWASSGAYSITNLTNDALLSSGYAVGDSINCNLNATGLASISLTAATRFTVLSSRDVSATKPTGSEYLGLGTGTLWITYTAEPNAPSNFAYTAATTTTLSYSWTDNSSDELGFKIKNAGGDTATVATSAAGAIADTVETLGINTYHGLRVFAFNAAGWSTPSDSVVTYTLANPPTSWNFTNIGATGTVDVGFSANSNPSATTFAIRDSTNTQWVQTDGTLGGTIAWATYATWNAVTITDPGVTGTVRYSVMARNGDNVNTAEITGTLYVYKYASPTSFDLTVLSNSSIQATWVNSTSGYDSLLIMNSPENTAVVPHISLAKTDTTITGLSVNTLYTWFIRADSSGTKGDSNADSLYTLANAPTTWAFTEGTLFHATPSFNTNSNPAATQYAIRDSLRHMWISSTGTTSGTKVWRTEAQWEAITISGLQCGRLYRFGVVAKNGDSIETSYLWGSLTMSSVFTTSQALEDNGLRSQNAVYATARDATAGTQLGAITVGQDSAASGYEVYRAWLTFPLPEAMSAVSACTLYVDGAYDYSTTNFDIKTYGANAYRPLYESTDFDLFNGRQTGGVHNGLTLNEDWNSSSYAAGWNKIVFSVAGRDSLLNNAPDSLAIAIISKEDSLNSAPAGVAAVSERLAFEPSTTAGKEPYLSFAYTPIIPDGLALSSTATDSIIAVWNDNSSDETGFRIIDADTYDYIDSVGVGVETIRKGGFGINTVHSWRIQVKGGDANGSTSTPDSTYTRAAIPGLITVTYPTTSLIKLVLNTSSNPSYTKIAIQDSISGKYIHLLGAGVADTLRTAVDWQTYASWGGASGCSLSVTPGKEYRLRAAARNTAN